MPDNDRLTELVGQDRQDKPRKYNKSNPQYPEVSAKVKADALATDIKFQSKALVAAAGRGRADFHDLADVKRRTQEYFDACANAGGAVLPSFIGLCTHGYGVSRSAVYKYLENHAGEDVAEFIERARDIIADILCSAALRRDADNSTAIFVLKNSHSFRDKLEIEAVKPVEPLGPMQSIEEIAAKYQDLPDD